MATVLEVTPHTEMKIKKITVLSDFSKNADIALRFAARVARAYKANIVLAHAHMPPSSAFCSSRNKAYVRSSGPLAAAPKRLPHCLTRSR